MVNPLLFLPGPMQVPDFISAAGRKPLFSHRSAKMLDFISKLEAACRPLFGTESADVLFFASSGTGAMESAVTNVTSHGDEVIVIVGGTFAERWAEIANAYGLVVHVVEADWRKGVTFDEAAAALDRWPKAEVVFHTWSESSTGVLNDLERIGPYIRSQRKLLVVDAVSGLAVSPMKMDSWNIDAAVVASQKGLMLPPGLGMAAVGPRAWEKYERSKTSRFYWDWRKYKRNVPFTPATSLLFELEAALEYLHSEGLEKIFSRRERVADRIRALVKRWGMEVYALRPGNGITGVLSPDGFDSAAFRRRLENDFAIQIAEGLGRLKHKTFRIGHVGYVRDEELDYFIHSFERCLN